jgi:hypothetical protein
MRRVRTKSLPEFCIKLPPASYYRIIALARNSNRDPVELIGMAISIFSTAVANIHMMHPPKKILKPKPPKTAPHVAPIGGTVQHIVRKLTKGKPR